MDLDKSGEMYDQWHQELEPNADDAASPWHSPNYFGLLGIYRAYRKVTRRGYTEVGQPINQPIKLIDCIRKLKSLGCKLNVVDGCGYYLYLPRIRHIPMRWLDRPQKSTKWFAAHSLTLATKL